MDVIHRCTCHKANFQISTDATVNQKRNNFPGVGAILRDTPVFGEGVNPRLRKLREGLADLGLDADDLLRHGRPRIVYGAALAHNMRTYLLGRGKRPNSQLAEKGKEDVTESIK